MRLTELRRPLNEDQGVDLSQIKALYHATHVGNLESIQQFGVIPMHGEIVQSTETYQQYEEWEEELDEIAFFSPEDPGFLNWQVGNYLKKDMWDVTADDIRQYGVATVLFPQNHGDEIYCYNDEGGATSLNGEDVLYEVPAHVESVDCFSLEAVMPDMILTGDKLITFLQKYFPSVLAQTAGRDQFFKARGKDPGYEPGAPEQQEMFALG